MPCPRAAAPGRAAAGHLAREPAPALTLVMALASLCEGVTAG